MRFVLHRLVILSLAVGLLILGVSVPVAAEDSTTDAPPTTAPTTTMPPTTDSGGAEESTDPTIVAQGAGTDTTLPSPSGEPDPDGETTTTLNDPLAQEPAPETVPETDITVPEDTDGITSQGRYAGQGEFKPTEVLFSSVEEAQRKVSDAVQDLEQTVSRAKALRLRIKELDVEIAALDAETQATLELLNSVKIQIQNRALSAFVRGTDAELSVGLDHDALVDMQVTSTIISSILDADRDTLVSYEDLRDMLDDSVVQVHDRKRLVQDLLADFEAEVERNRFAVDQAERELETFAAGSPVYIEGVVFPVGDFDYEMPLIDSYGFPRMLGTEDEHWHEGIDIFAPLGAPLVAAERGIITRVNSSELGGLTVWLRGESGTDWYYAHLSGFAEELHTTQVVEAGDLLGFVGISGNAVGTPPHLHMQIHPGGDDAVNPYPLLFVASEREIAADAEEKARVVREEELRRIRASDQEAEWIRRYDF